LPQAATAAEHQAAAQQAALLRQQLSGVEERCAAAEAQLARLQAAEDSERQRSAAALQERDAFWKQVGPWLAGLGAGQAAVWRAAAWPPGSQHSAGRASLQGPALAPCRQQAGEAAAGQGRRARRRRLEAAECCIAAV
jgi:hypothetical protein